MNIEAIVIDGFHEGHVLHMPYQQTIRLLKPTVVMIDTCCGGELMMPEPVETIEYKECFRAVDRKVVLYSLKGESRDAFRMFPAIYSRKPWTKKTTLYYGYHDGFIKREDENQ